MLYSATWCFTATPQLLSIAVDGQEKGASRLVEIGQHVAEERDNDLRDFELFVKEFLDGGPNVPDIMS